MRWEQTGIILHTVNHTVVSSGLVHKHTPVERTLPCHKSNRTTHKRDSKKKGFYICASSRRWVTVAIWRMPVGENTCILSVGTGSLQTCWHTFVNTGWPAWYGAHLVPSDSRTLPHRHMDASTPSLNSPLPYLRRVILLCQSKQTGLFQCPQNRPSSHCYPKAQPVNRLRKQFGLRHTEPKVCSHMEKHSVQIT